ncbi:hypothetical protein A7K91_13370 [Paenibacillus oryzae]|uniref:Transposase zinc-ribbon domain-containing protein n=1 Tax=Paenibacillus oryzae TaxID=1844972 RepID=A0A1A5YFX0_9BACL|nr:hypothetical protein [Paenibacillus oryzae]OBR64477.1 hypothetical protein A7K91_13370 [Paenibacillus oryzae]
MKRFIDEPPYRYNYYSVLRRGEPIDVKCPRCGGHACITAGENDVEWRCFSCYAKEVKEPLYQYRAKQNCNLCQRWFNVEVTDKKKISHSHTHVECPHCGSVNQCRLQRSEAYRGYYGDIRNGRDPLFGMELYFSDYVRGKAIWALNRSHLDYLIAYISADLRVRAGQAPLKTASHYLPSYMKLAKNRAVMIKTLTKLQFKR